MKMHIRRASDAAENHIRYKDWIERNPHRALPLRLEFVAAYSDSLDSINGIPPQVIDRSTGKAIRVDNQTVMATAMLNTERNVLEAASPVFVTEHAHALIDEASALLPDDEIILASERTPTHLALWFEKPYPYDLMADTGDAEFEEEHWEVRLIIIQNVPNMATREHPEDEGPGLQVAVYGAPTVFGERQPLDFEEKTGGLLPIDLIGVRCGNRPVFSFGPAPWVSALRRWVIAMFRLMGDHIEREPVRLDRPARRRLERMGFPVDGYLTELRLRKVLYSESGDGSGSGAPLRFRHRVRGHWRKFYCPSTARPVGDPEAYRYRYVNDYIRGPKESPMVESQQVVTLSR